MGAVNALADRPAVSQVRPARRPAAVVLHAERRPVPVRGPLSLADGPHM